uniref:RNA-directed DNA polymerase, eukaryota, reverse transcriptase zinc-binding domain protein n=1 Tax=Tanacetum cinerariifolium TaxID=118510 RepID=A0A699IQL8_TANCI|nr:hypothetical protein [Tanacetum cinerariifolium]
MAGLKIILTKSKLYGVGMDHSAVESMARWMRCGVGEFSFTYLGLSIRICMRKEMLGEWVFGQSRFLSGLVLVGPIRFSDREHLVLGGAGDSKKMSWVNGIGRYYRMGWGLKMGLLRQNIGRLLAIGTGGIIKVGCEIDKTRVELSTSLGRLVAENLHPLGVINGLSKAVEGCSWSLSGKGIFSVKELSNIIDDKCLFLNGLVQETRWNSANKIFHEIQLKCYEWVSIRAKKGAAPWQLVFKRARGCLFDVVDVYGATGVVHFFVVGFYENKEVSGVIWCYDKESGVGVGVMLMWR